MKGIVYFRYPNGYVVPAPYSEFPTPAGCDREETHSLQECYELERKIQSQEHLKATLAISDEMMRDMAHDAYMLDKFHARMNSAATTDYEKQFLEEWIKLRDHRKKEKYARLLDDHNVICRILHYDVPRGRRDDDERANIDRITVKR